MRHILFPESLFIKALLVPVIAVGGGCATKRYVHNQVNESAETISTRIDEQQQGITTLGQEMEHIGSSQEEFRTTQEQHSERVSSLQNDVEQVRTSHHQTQAILMQTQETADVSLEQVAVLRDRFESRHHYGVLTEQSVLFNFDSFSVDQDYLNVLVQAARTIHENSDAFIVLEGHTDTTGDESYNVQLGKRRLDTVVHRLVIEHGVPLHRIHQLSFGEAKPRSSNTSQDGRAQNRRVSIQVLGPKN